MNAHGIRTGLLLAGIALLMALPASAGPIRLSFPHMTVVGGTTFDYPLNVDSTLTGEGVTAYQLEISYTDALVFVGVTTEGTMSAGWGSVEVNETSPGIIRIAAAGPSPLAGIGELIALRFQAKTYDYYMYANVYFLSAQLNEGSPATTTQWGSVNIELPPSLGLAPNSALLVRNETLQFSASDGTPPYTWTSTAPSVGTIDSTGLLTAIAAGVTRVVCADSAGIVDTTGTIEVRGVKVSIPDTGVYQGYLLRIPLRVTDLSGLGITAGQFVVSYSPWLWTPEGIHVTGTLLDGYAVPEFGVEESSVRIAFAGSTVLSGSGVLLYIDFRASLSNQGSSTLGFAEAVFNETQPAVTDGASVSVEALGSLPITPSGPQVMLVGDSLQFSVSGGTAPYVWTVSDSSVASVSEAGWLRGISRGSVVVTATDAVGASGHSGAVSVYDFRLALPETTAVPSASIEIPMLITPSDSGFISYQMKVVYSTHTHLVLDSVLSGGTLSSGWTIERSHKPGEVMIAASGTGEISAGGTLLRLRFQVADSTPSPSTTSIEIQNAVFNEGVPLPLIKNGSIQLDARAIFGISATSLVFRTNSLSETDTASLTVGNTGTATLTSWQAVSGSSAFQVTPGNLSIAPGDSAIVTVTYQAQDFTTAAATLQFNTNDPYNATIAVSLTGTTNQPPVLVSRLPESLDSIEVGTAVTFTVSGSDADGDTLTFVWKVNGVVEQSGPDSAFGRTFAALADVSVVAVVTDPFGLSDSTTWSFRVVTAVTSPVSVVPSEFSLQQNYPNPFNPSTVIRFTLPVSSLVRLEVFNAIGELVETLADGPLDAGAYDLLWNAGGSSGVYYYRLTAIPLSGGEDVYVGVRRMLLLK